MTSSTLNAMVFRDWGYLACRVLALYLFYLAIDTLLSIGIFTFMSPSAGENARFFNYYYILRFLLAIAAGLVLWFGAPRLAHKMVPRHADETEEAVPGEWHVTLLLSLAVSVLGLVLLFFAIPQAAGLAARYLVADRLHDGDLVEITVVATQLVLGIVLVFGSGGIANLIGWARKWRVS